MNNLGMTQNAFAAYEEMRGTASFAAGDRKPPLFCPKPRRLCQLAGPVPVKPVQWQASNQIQLSDCKAGMELTDLFLAKGGEVASSPPFFSGSPPSRAANPVVHDVRFGENAAAPMSPRKACARAKFGLKPAAVRIEGFDCRLDRDRRSITAVA